MNTKDEIISYILESSKIIENSSSLSNEIEKVVEEIVKAFSNGKKIILFGNGGSAADAQHIAAEFIGRFKKERKSLPAIALTTDTSIITALSNDYSVETIFSRQCESLVNDGDIVIGISTSGNSKNVYRGLLTSKKKGAITISFLGNEGGEIGKIVEIPIIVKSTDTARIQEVHRVLYHIVCDLVEKSI